MKEDSLEGRGSHDQSWIETKRKIKARWDKLSSEQIEKLQDNEELLPQQLVKTYGFSEDFAKEESESFFNGMETKDDYKSAIGFGNHGSDSDHEEQRRSATMKHSNHRNVQSPESNSPYFDDQP
jgi:hypothetical protein